VTEAEAYDTIGWPPEGSVFVLPLSGDDRHKRTFDLGTV